MRLVDQWREIEAGLPDGWNDVRLRLTVADDARAARAAALLGPVNPGRLGKEVRFYATRSGAGPSPGLIRRLLARLDSDWIDGELEAASVGKPEDTPLVGGVVRRSLSESWDADLAVLPPDWSDVYAELELASTDHLERAALLMAPVNPARFGGKPAFRFRSAQTFGYGASPEMVRRCLARLDEAGIRGRVRLLHALSDTRPVATQGPVWYVGGRSV